MFPSVLISAATAALLFLSPTVISAPTASRALEPRQAADIYAALQTLQGEIPTIAAQVKAASDNDYTVPLTTLNNYLDTVKNTLPSSSSKRDLDTRQTVSASEISGLLGDILEDLQLALAPVLAVLSGELLPEVEVLLADVGVALDFILTGVEAIVPGVIALLQSVVGAVAALVTDLNITVLTPYLR